MGFSKNPISLFLFFRNPSLSSSTSLASLSSFIPFIKPLSSLASSSSLSFFPPSFLPASPPSIAFDRTSKEIASFFKQWFRSRDPTIFDLLFKILSSYDSDDDIDAALSRLHLGLSESFVLQVLAHLRPRDDASDVLPCLKFFDWAGRQHRFQHTRGTYHAIFKILSRARLMTVMLDWLHTFAGHRNLYRVRFHDTLIMGYAVAGKPDIALHLFAKMRFQGLDLDPFAYHVLLNSLLEDSCFDVAEVIFNQISIRGLENEITSCIRIKSLCKQGRLDDAEAFFRQLDTVNEHMVGVLLTALCKLKRFGDACALVEEFEQSAKVPMAPIYNIWISDLVDAGRVDGAFNLFKSKKKTEGYVPQTLCYNKLICALLRENRLEEVYDLLVEMREEKIEPDKVTMNVAMCFFCKAGMVDVAVELYNSRLEIGLTPNSFSYNHLINALCGDGSTDEACLVLEDSLKQGYFPGKKAFQALIDALWREGKLDKMSKLMDVALQGNFRPSNALCVKYISALCKVGKPDEGYLVPAKLNKSSAVLNRCTYGNLISAFSRLKRGDMASRLLLEMQQSGYTPSRNLFRAVICCLCEMNSLDQVLNLLDLFLSLDQNEGDDKSWIFNYFIDGAGHAKKPELMSEVFERMLSRGFQPNMGTDILVMQGFLKSNRISDAINFFNDLAGKHGPSNRLHNIMIVGLCKAGRADYALEKLNEVREKGMVPSLQCYEELVHVFCTAGSYDQAVEVLKDFQKTGRHVSSFICNVLLLHTLKETELNRAWVKLSDVDGEESPSTGSSMLGQLIGAFSGGIRVKEHLDSLEEVIEQLFPVNIYTCNMLLKGLSMGGRMDYACDLFHRICKKGYEPNRWTYDIIVHGFCKHGRRKEAERWMEAMFQKGFSPTECTLEKLNNMEIKGGS